MKKIIIPVLLLCLLLTACVQGSPREQLQNMQQTTAASTTSSSMTVVMTTVPTTAPTTIPTTAPTTVPTTAPTTVPTTRPVMLATTRATTKPVLGPGSSSYITLTTYEDYLAYISEKSLPLDFIKYDQLPSMGEFGAVRLKIWNIDGPYSAYVYEIELSSGLRYSVSINHKYKHKNYEHEDISHKGNLRELADKGVGVKCYEQAGVTYKFINGGLNDIEWEYNGIHFIINAMRHSTEERWDTTNGPDFIQDLLHTDTVEKAMQSFKASMESAAVK